MNEYQKMMALTTEEYYPKMVIDHIRFREDNEWTMLSHKNIIDFESIICVNEEEPYDTYKIMEDFSVSPNSIFSRHKSGRIPSECKLIVVYHCLTTAGEWKQDNFILEKCGVK